ncbi:MAG TPA: hypothetical protein VF938_08305, partial [Candidatus Angelobacter sp.]
MDTNREFVQQLMSKADEPMWTANATLADAEHKHTLARLLQCQRSIGVKRAIEEKIRKKAVYY